MKKLIHSISTAAALTFSLGCSSNDPLPVSSGTGGSAGAPGSAGAGGKATTSGGVSSTGGASGGGQTSTGGVSGGGGGAGGSAGSATGGGGGAGGAGDGWVKIFNGVDLTGWFPLIHKSTYKNDPYNTFRADAANKVIKVTYEDYPGDNFDDRCGLLYYDKPLKNYRVRLTYRFLEPQAKNPVSWGKNNSGLMIFGIPPTEVTGDPMFPPLIEIQLLGNPSSGGSTNVNLCEPGGMTMTVKNGGCGNNATNIAPPPAAEWVTVEAEVLVNGDTKVYQHPNLTTPLLTMSGPMYNGQPVTGGYLSLQTESQPIEYKDIELKELP